MKLLACLQTPDIFENFLYLIREDWSYSDQILQVAVILAKRLKIFIFIFFFNFHSSFSPKIFFIAMFQSAVTFHQTKFIYLFKHSKVLLVRKIITMNKEFYFSNRKPHTSKVLKYSQNLVKNLWVTKYLIKQNASNTKFSK